MTRILLALFLTLAACQNETRTPLMPAGGGAVSHEVGFSAYCAENPGRASCP